MSPNAIPICIVHNLESDGRDADSRIELQAIQYGQENRAGRLELGKRLDGAEAFLRITRH
jgi:hypothetical protein